MASDIQLIVGTGYPQLWSVYERISVVLRSHSSYGDGSFSDVGQCVWNALPSYL